MSEVHIRRPTKADPSHLIFTVDGNELVMTRRKFPNDAEIVRDHWRSGWRPPGDKRNLVRLLERKSPCAA